MVAITLVASASAQAEDCKRSDLTQYLERLGELRGGDDGAALPLKEIAAHLCEAHDRCDTIAVARYYASLSVAERAAGLEAEREYMALRQAVVDAAGTPEEWPTLRPEIVSGLNELARRVESEADFAPAARAYALLAMLDVELVEGSASLANDERERILRQTEAHARQAIALFERAAQITPQLEPMWILGRTSRARTRPAQASSDFQRCRDLAVEVGREDYRERALFGLVSLARDAGDVARLDRILAELATFRDPRTSWALAREHGSRLLHSDHPEAALDFLLQHEPELEDELEEWHALVAATFLRTGDAVSARAELAALSETQDSQLVRLVRASLDLHEGKHQAVIDGLADAPLEAWSPLRQAQTYALLGEAWLGLDQFDRAISWLEGALERASDWRDLQAAHEGGSVIGEWIGLHTVVSLARAQASSGDALGAFRVIESYQSRQLRPDAPELSGDDILDWAAQYSAGAITWCVGADQTVVAHVGPGGDTWAATIDKGRRAFEDAVRRLRQATLSDNEAQRLALAEEISAVLFPEALRTRIEAAQGDLLLLLHGPLEALPATLLVLGADALVADYNVCVLPGLPALTRAQRFESASAWTYLGDPRQVSAPELPGARRELAALHARNERSTLVAGADFTRATLLASLNQGNALHIATHLAAADDCSGDRMSDLGLLTSRDEVVCANEIAARRPQLPLVVLAACATASGRSIDAEGQHGVARAFLEGGTVNLIVTLWPITDEAGLAYSQALHAALEHGTRPAQAHQAAVLELRRGGFEAADWGAFRYLGLN